MQVWALLFTGKLYECLHCSPGGLFALNVNKGSCFGLYCICLHLGPGENLGITIYLHL